MDGLIDDTLRLVLKWLPLVIRLTILRQVNSVWKATVDSLGRSQHTLTLVLGRGGHRQQIVNKLQQAYYEIFPIQAVSPAFHQLTAAELTAELATTLSTATFPSLKTLVVIIDDFDAEDLRGNRALRSLLALPPLITAYANSLTTLQVVWNVSENAFLPSFPMIIESIQSLRCLQRLSFFDYSTRLTMPPFDLPHQLANTLTTFDFHSENSPFNLFHHWADSLAARNRHRSTVLGRRSTPPLQIYFLAAITTDVINLPFSAHLDHPFHPFRVTSNLGVHFARLGFTSVRTMTELELLIASFPSLTCLLLATGGHLSTGAILERLCRLPHLARLGLRPLGKTVEATSSGYPRFISLPVAPNLQELYLDVRFLLMFQSCRQLRAYVGALHFDTVFPNLINFRFLYNDDHRCTKCGKQVSLGEDGCRESEKRVSLEESGSKSGGRRTGGRRKKVEWKVWDPYA
ncbi:hypothetical protein TYRP_006241 [Tyrophagus putrescentiae]|nr:hypothetical protein TYRP_006241 [Tyrophagus putrescentiae]